MARVSAWHRAGAGLALAALLASCGGGGGGGGSASGPTSTNTPTPSPSATPTPTASAGCTLRERQQWAAQQLREWYLFPETLPATLDPAPYASVSDYVDALTATARSQRRDRYFTYVTSIEEEDGYYEAGETAGFGVRFALDTGNRVVVTESFEGGPALAAGIDRGSTIEAIGTTSGNLRDTPTIYAQQGGQGLTDALGPETAGTTRYFRVRQPDGRVFTTAVTKADFNLTPVSNRYGAKVIDAGNGSRVGYVNLRTFIEPAERALRDAFAGFRAAGVTNVVVDLRYNGGGLVSVAQLFGDLLGANRTATDVFSFTTFRPEKAEYNETRTFASEPQSIAPTRIAFIGTGGTASASELVINAMSPYLGTNMALVGSNTYGKPVGQVALDLEQCDDRLRVIAFKTENANRQGDYYNGLAAVVPQTCQASDDISRQLGDPAEASTAAAINFLLGRSCTRILGTQARTLSTTAGGTGGRTLLQPERPSTAQREVPGLY
jgi:carboxyl-terminal processing protease